MTFIVTDSDTSANDESIPKVIVQLAAKKIVIENEEVLAVNFKTSPHWHTYWKNPGDAGLPIKVTDIESGDQLDSFEMTNPSAILNQVMHGRMAMKTSTLCFINYLKRKFFSTSNLASL